MLRKKRKKTVFDVIVTQLVSVVFMLVFVLMVFFVYCSMTNKAPSIAGYQMLRVVTGSMEPTYPVNCYIVVKETPSEKLKVGDVISFYSRDEAIQGKINTHRIQEINVSGSMRAFLTKGDANEVSDSIAVQQNDIIGKVIFRASLLDTIGKLIRNPWIYFVCIVGPLAVMVIVEMKNVILASLDLKKKGNEQAVLEEAKMIADNIIQSEQAAQEPKPEKVHQETESEGQLCESVPEEQLQEPIPEEQLQELDREHSIEENKTE